jgi:hypothetical protein
MSLGSRDVDEASFGEQEQQPSVGELELLDEVARIARLDGQ